ncbi:beta-N-acetylhexosaminidase [Agromyces fucosus]|uniref:beta-N-acetylhexosaminidase n=1 Tax=Agromyces fucosus TaxID=41985 RepID=A0A4Q2JKW4_9MICO|nr:family 20 glycosylhydrolase [Agromyces fucosus]RXZ48765.1 beta-N-acetylhexosaminidase [Agromyces fucosus]
MPTRFRLAAAVTVAAVAFAAVPVAASATEPTSAATPTTGSTALAAMPANLALEAVATASSTELDEARFAPTQVNDGDISTRWSSKYVDASWLQLELAEPADVATIVIDWPNACARSYRIQTSVDGVSWTTEAERSAQVTCPRIDEISIDVDEPVGFVRMQGVTRWSTWGYSVSEFRVYDQPLPEPQPQLPLVPAPVSLERAEGAFVLADDIGIEASGDALDAAEYLAELMRPSTGLALPIAAPGEAGERAIEISVAPGNAPAGHEAEGYTLDVTAAGIELAADTPAGALNGVQTLRQLLPAWVESDQVTDIEWSVPFVAISDYPRFEHRGLMVDTARSFYTVDEVKRLIDSAAPLKLNRLHLHLTDDQGWRIAMDVPAENPSGIDYDALTTISGATAMTYSPTGTLMGTELGHTGFYTKEDYREIVEYAGENGMTVIPEIDLPGHTNAALHAIPQLNSAGSNPKPLPGETTAPHQGTGQVGISTFDADNEHTYTFITEVLRQVAELTPGEYLHIGGDEAHTTSHEDYVEMVDFATATVADLGKTVVGWNEYASTNLPQDAAVVQLWTGNGASTRDAVDTRGAKVILSPANKTYMPQKQDSRQPLGGTWACGGPCTLENAYNWNPATQIPGVAEESILGVEAAFWGEFIRGVDQAQFYTFPRLLATAEAGWTPQDGKVLAEFIDRVGQLGPRMTAQGVNFFPTSTVDWRVDAAPTVAGGGDAAVGSTVDIGWRVIAPDTAAADVAAELVWDDGQRQPVALVGTAVTDIAAMTMNSAYAGTSGRGFETAGAHVGRLEVTVGGGEPVLAGEVSVTVVDAGLDLDTVVTSRCVASKAVLSVRATNGEDVPLAVTFTSPYGTKAFETVAAGKNAFHAFSTRLSESPAGEVSIEATAVIDGVPVSTTSQVPYEARSCG